MRPTIQLKKIIYRNFTFSNWTRKSFRSIKRRVARSVDFYPSTAAAQLQLLHRHSTQIWANVPRTRWLWVCARELPSSLHKKANPSYFNSVIADNLTLPGQINTWQKGQGVGVVVCLEKSNLSGNTLFAWPSSVHCEVPQGCPLVQVWACYGLQKQYSREQHKIQRLAVGASM